MSSLQTAIDALQSGQKSSAVAILKQLLIENPRDPAGWVWLARALDDPARKRDCLERALRLDPQNSFARRTLDELEHAAAPVEPVNPAPEPPAPQPETPVRPPAREEVQSRPAAPAFSQAHAPRRGNSTAFTLSEAELQAYLEAELVDDAPPAVPQKAAPAVAPLPRPVAPTRDNVTRAQARRARARRKTGPDISRLAWFAFALLMLIAAVYSAVKLLGG